MIIVMMMVILNHTTNNTNDNCYATHRVETHLLPVGTTNEVPDRSNPLEAD